MNDKRLIVDRSTTGGDGNDAYAWSFRTEVPKTTTNEQLKRYEGCVWYDA